MAGFRLRAELGRRVERWVDLPSDTLLRRGGRGRHIWERRVAHDHEVDVAAGAERASCRRTEHEGGSDPAGEGTQALADDVDDACRFQDDGPELAVDGAG